MKRETEWKLGKIQWKKLTARHDPQGFDENFMYVFENVFLNQLLKNRLGITQLVIEM